MRNVCNATLRSLASAMFRHFLHSISVSLCRSLKCFHRKAGRRLMQIYHHQSYIHLGIAKHIASIGAIQCERRCSSTKGNSRPGPWANCLVRGLLPITGTEMRQLGSWFAGFLQQPISSLWTHWNPFFHFTQQPAAEQNQDARLTLPSSCATASRHLCDGACRQRWRCDNRYFARTNIRDLGVSKSLESLKGRRIYNFFSCVFFFFFHPFDMRVVWSLATLLPLLLSAAADSFEVATSSSLPAPITFEGKRYRCKCFPGDSCYPKEQQWRALNNTVNGNLRAAAPPGAVCYSQFDGKPSFDAQACQEVQTALNTADEQWMYVISLFVEQNSSNNHSAPTTLWLACGPTGRTRPVPRSPRVLTTTALSVLLATTLFSRRPGNTSRPALTLQESTTCALSSATPVMISWVDPPASVLFTSTHMASRSTVSSRSTPVRRSPNGLEEPLPLALVSRLRSCTASQASRIPLSPLLPESAQ